MVQTHQYNTAEADVFSPLFPFFPAFAFPQDSQSDLVAPCRLLCQPQMV